MTLPVESTRGRVRLFIRNNADILLAAVSGFALMVPALLSSEDYYGSGTDLVTQEMPQLAFFARWAKAGTLPLWNPFAYNGVAFPAGTGAYFYPPSWLLVLVSVGVAIKLTFALHLALAGAGGAWFCRSRVKSRISSYVGGAAFAMSGFMTSHMFAGHVHMVAAAAYVPWVVAVTDRFRRREPVGWGPSILLFAMATLSAHYQMFAMGALSSGLFVVCESAFGADPVRARMISAGRALVGLGALIVSGVLVAAVQVVPLAEALSFTQRHAVDDAFANSGAQVPGNLLTMLIPRLFGDNAEAPFVGDFYFWEAFGYVGVVTLSLGLLALHWLPRSRWFGAACTATIGLGLTLGDRTPLLRVLWFVLPPFHEFRSAGRYVVIVTLFVALLAAMGLDAFLSAEARAPRAGRLLGPLALAATALVALVALGTCTDLSFSHAVSLLIPVRSEDATRAWPKVLGAARSDAVFAAVLLGGTVYALAWGASRIRRERAAFGIAALLVLDLARAASPFLGTEPKAVTDWFQPLAAGCEKSAGPGGRILATPELVAPNVGMPYDLASISGYTTFFDDRYARFINRANGAPLDTFIAAVLPNGNERMLRHLGTALLVTSEALVGSDGRAHLRMGSYHPIGGMGKRLTVLAADSPVSRAVLVHKAIRVDRETDAYAAMEAPDFDIAQTALVEEEVEPLHLAKPPAGAVESARIVEYEPNRVVVDVEATTDGLLVLSDAFEPGWTARVDATPAPILFANRVMRAVRVSAGHHRVVMSYWPPGLTAGAWGTGCGLFGVAILLLLPRRKHLPVRGGSAPLQQAGRSE